MKKLLLSFGISFLFLSILPLPSSALTTELISETEQEKVFTILANPPVDSSAIQLRLSVSGGTITNVERVEDGKLSYIPVCENGEIFDGENICTEIAFIDGIFLENQELLKVTVSSDPGTEVVFSPNDSHAYLTINGELMRENGEVIQDSLNTNTIENIGPIVSDAKTNNTNYLPFVLLLGVLVVLVGAFLAVVLFSDKGSTKE